MIAMITDEYYPRILKNISHLLLNPVNVFLYSIKCNYPRQLDGQDGIKAI